MPDHLRSFLEALVGVATAGILVTGIFSSGLPDAEKWFAIAMFFLVVYIIYAEQVYQKKPEKNGDPGKKTVKGSKQEAKDRTNAKS